MGAVRVYFLSGFEPPPAPLGTWRWPYLSAELLETDTRGSVTSQPAPHGAKVCVVLTNTTHQIEISPANMPRTIEPASPYFIDEYSCAVGPEWTVTVREDANG